MKDAKAVVDADAVLQKTILLHAAIVIMMIMKEMIAMDILIGEINMEAVPADVVRQADILLPAAIVITIIMKAMIVMENVIGEISTEAEQ